MAKELEKHKKAEKICESIVAKLNANFVNNINYMTNLNIAKIHAILLDNMKYIGKKLLQEYIFH